MPTAMASVDAVEGAAVTVGVVEGVGVTVSVVEAIGAGAGVVADFSFLSSSFPFSTSFCGFVGFVLGCGTGLGFWVSA